METDVGSRLATRITIKCTVIGTVIGLTMTVLWSLRLHALNEALLNAVRLNDTKTAIVLLRRGAEPNYRAHTHSLKSILNEYWELIRGRQRSGPVGPSMLHILCEMHWDQNGNWVGLQENVPLARALLNAGADANAIDQLGRTPLYLSVAGRRDGIASLLLDRNADVDIRTKEGDTALMLEVGGNEGETELMLRMLAHAHSVNTADETGHTALMSAARDGKAYVVRQMILMGANVNARDQSGYTPLILAAMNDRSTIVKELMDHRADWRTRCCTGDTALSWARREKSSHAAAILTQSGAKY